jgi:hypothetical protein
MFFHAWIKDQGRHREGLQDNYNNPLLEQLYENIKVLLDDLMSHSDLRTNPNARIHVRQNQVTHMHRRSEYQNTV